MRTTLTIDSDVAALLERVRARGDRRLKDVVNEALRRGLSELVESGDAASRSYRTRSVSLGRPRLPDVDDVAATLAVVESDAFR